jgi:hypothetical protein
MAADMRVSHELGHVNRLLPPRSMGLAFFVVFSARFGSCGARMTVPHHSGMKLLLARRNEGR